MNIVGVNKALKEQHLQYYGDLVEDMKIKLIHLVYLLTTLALEIIFLSIIISHMSGKNWGNADLRTLSIMFTASRF